VKTGYGTPPAPGALRCERQADDTLLVHLVGHWTIRAGAPIVAEVYQQLDASPPLQRLAFAAEELTAWDTRLLTFVRQVMEMSTRRQVVVEQQGLPEGVRRLLALAAAVPEREGARRGTARLSWLASIGTAVLTGGQGARDLLEFIGQVILACGRLVTGQAASDAPIWPSSCRKRGCRPWAL